LEVLVDLYEYLTRQLTRMNRKVLELSRTDKYRGRAELLRTAPGVGLLTGMEILVELQDMGRFRSSEEIASYMGLTPLLSPAKDGPSPHRNADPLIGFF